MVSLEIDGASLLRLFFTPSVFYRKATNRSSLTEEERGHYSGRSLAGSYPITSQHSVASDRSSGVSCEMWLTHLYCYY